MIEAFHSGVDIHTKTGKFRQSDGEGNSDTMSAAKAVNFGIIYGISDFGLAKQLDIEEESSRTYQ